MRDFDVLNQPMFVKDGELNNEERVEIIIEDVVSSALFTFWDEQKGAEVAGNIEDYSDE